MRSIAIVQATPEGIYTNLDKGKIFSKIIVVIIHQKRRDKTFLYANALTQN